MTYTLSLLDVCTSDFFYGYAPTPGKSELLAVPVFCEMTQKQFYDAVMNEWLQGDDTGLQNEQATVDAVRAFLAPFTGDMKCTQSEFTNAIGIQHAPSVDDCECETVYVYLSLTLDV